MRFAGGLARQMKISRAYLCDIEKGRRAAHSEKAAAFCEGVGVSGESLRRARLKGAEARRHPWAGLEETGLAGELRRLGE